jgi:predicted dehydrogenase
MNQCIHYIDLLQWLMGPVRSVYAQAGTFGQHIAVENAGAAILRFQSGAIGVIEASTGIYPRSAGTSISLFGDKGSAIIEGDGLNDVKLWRFEDEVQSGEMSTVADVISHTPLYEDLITCIRTGEAPLVSVDSTLDSLEIVFAIYQSAASGKAVQLPLQRFDMRQLAEWSD